VCDNDNFNLLIGCSIPLSFLFENLRYNLNKTPKINGVMTIESGIIKIRLNPPFPIDSRFVLIKNRIIKKEKKRIAIPVKKPAI